MDALTVAHAAPNGPAPAAIAPVAKPTETICRTSKKMTAKDVAVLSVDHVLQVTNFTTAHSALQGVKVEARLYSVKRRGIFATRHVVAHAFNREAARTNRNSTSARIEASRQNAWAPLASKRTRRRVVDASSRSRLFNFFSAMSSRSSKDRTSATRPWRSTR